LADSGEPETRGSFPDLPLLFPLESGKILKLIGNEEGPGAERAGG
jgi:hypothetical protein